MCPIVYLRDRLYISLQIGVFYDNHLHGNQVPDTKWISGILNLSLVRGAHLTAVSSEPFSQAQESVEGSPGPSWA